VFFGDLPLHDICLQFDVKIWQNKLMMMMMMMMMMIRLQFRFAVRLY